MATAVLVLPAVQSTGWAVPPPPDAPCTVTGTDGPDTLSGTVGDDVICGRGGDDTINARGGDDVVRAGDGNDSVLGGPGNDYVVGGAGDDTIDGGEGADVVRGQGGADLLKGFNGDDDLSGGDGNDDVRGNAGADLVAGSDGDDTINGGDGNDEVLGGAGIDRLLGSTGGDRMFGGLDDDTVSGGDDDDDVRGGPGDDVLLGGNGDDVLFDRDGAGFVDRAVCGAGADQAFVDVYDIVNADCEVRRNIDRDPPVAVGDAAAVSEDDPATTIDVRANDTDADGGPISVESVTQPGNGTVVITNGGDDLTYEPDADYCNSGAGPDDTFTYTLNGGSTAPVAVTVACMDDAAVAIDDTASVAEDDPATTVDVRANDFDVDGGPISVGSVTQPGNGTVVITNGGDDLTYEPDADYCNSGAGPDDTFTYTLDGGDQATVSVTVTCVNDDPVAVDDSATVGEDDPAAPVDVLTNDIDVDGDIAIDSVTQPADGAVVITGSGAGLTYEPDPDFCNDPPGTTTDDFTYTLEGGSTATVAVTVSCVDDDPVAVDDSATVGQDSSATAVDVLANDTDIDAGPKAIASATQPDNGTVVLTGGSVGAHTGLTYEPDPGYCNDPGAPGDDTFTYTLNGGSTATVSVVVTCDAPPTAVDDTATVGEDDPATAIDVLANDTDPDGGPIGVQSVTQPADGTVVITNGGDDLTYEPDADYCNDPPGTTDDFTYTLNGGSTAAVAVTVTCADDGPVAVDDSATLLEDANATAVPVLANDTDVDAGPQTISSASDPANGTVVLTGGSPGAHTGLTYQPDPNYCNDPPGTTPDTFTYTLNGGSTATVSVTVTCVADPATIDNSAGNTGYTENAAATVVDSAVTITNVDGLTITAASADISGGFAAGQDSLDWVDNDLGDSITEGASTNQTILLTGNGTAGEYEAALEAVTYANSSDDPNTAPRTVTFSITAGVDSPSDTKGLTVTPVDDPPTAVNDSTTMLEDAAATPVGVLANDTDVDAGPKTISSASDPANGTVVLTGGSPGAHTGLTYQPDPNYCNDPPGTTPDTFTYTLNGGSTATVSVTVTCVNDAPVADDETFSGASSAVGNTALVVNDADDTAPALSAPKKSISGDILAGDTDVDGPGPLTITPGTFASNDGGSVTIEADGDFIFRPAASTSCTDTSDFFDYTVEDTGTPEQTDTGRVTIALTGCVWYVNNNDPTGNAGTSTAPFDTLAQAETASAAGHTIFVFDGDNTTTGYAAGINLKANQVLTSEVADLVVGADTLHTGVPGTRPTLTDNNADVVDLDDNTTVRGFVIDPQGTGGGIAGSTGDTGGGTIDNVSITDAGTPGSQPLLELDATTGTFNVSNFDVDSSGASSNPSTATGVRLNNAGTVVFAPSGTITLTTEGARAIDATGTALGTSTIDAITVTASGVGAVSMTNTTATAVSLGDDSGADLNLTTTGGTALLLNNAANVTVGTTGTDEVHATGGPAVDITGAGSFTFDDVDSTNSTGDGINLDNFGTGIFTAPNGSVVTGAAGIGLDLNGGSGNVTYDGTINTSGASSRPVEITGRTGGTVDLNGTVTGTGQGVNLATNAGATIRFDGGLSLATTTSTAFDATGGGTVVVTDPNAVGTAPDNTLTATSAAALNVVSTTIGADDLNFRSIASGNSTAAADPANGIVLNTTGSAGGLTVSGNGASCTSAATCTGGAIQNSTASGIVLNGVGGGVSLTRMAVTGSADDGIAGTTVVGLSLISSVVLLNGNSTTDRGLDLFDLTGSGGITSSTISGSSESNVRIENNTAAALTAFNITGTTISDTSMVTGDDGLLVLNDGAGSMTVSVTGSTFTDNKGDHFQAASDADASGAIHATFDNNTLTTTAGNDPNVVGGGITINTSGTLDIDFHVGSNTIQQAFDDAINLNLDPGSQAGATFVGTVTGNTIGTAGVVDSGSESSNAITFAAKGAGTATVAITNNFIRQWANLYGIFVGATEGSPVVNATVTGNLVKEPGTFAVNGIRVDAGATAGPPPDASVLCVVLTGNDATGSGVDVNTDIRLRQRFNTTIRLPGYGGTTSDTTAVNSFVSANNTGGPTVSSAHNVGGGGGGFVGGAACTTP